MSIPAWRIPWTQEPGGLLPMGSQRVGHNWATEHIHTHRTLKRREAFSHPAIFEKAVSQEEVWILAFMGDNGMERFLRQDGCQDYIDYKAWISSPFPHTKWLRTSFHMKDPNLQASIQLPSWMTLPTYGIQMTFFLRHHSNFRRLHTPSQGWGSPACETSRTMKYMCSQASWTLSD